MVQPVIAQLADAVVAELNAPGSPLVPAEGDLLATAVRAYAPVFDLGEMANLHVTVVPKSLSAERVDRASRQFDYSIDVAVQKKLGCPPDAGNVEIDGLMLLVERIGDHFNGKLKAIADKIAAIESPTKRAAVAQMMFGRGGTAMLPLLSQGAAGMNKLMAEADRLGITMSTADAAGAVEFRDSMSTLWAVLKRVRDHLAALVPTLMAAARWLTDVAGNIGAWLRANQGLLLTIFQVAIGIVEVLRSWRCARQSLWQGRR